MLDMVIIDGCSDESLLRLLPLTQTRNGNLTLSDNVYFLRRATAELISLQHDFRWWFLLDWI